MSDQEYVLDELFAAAKEACAKAYHNRRHIEDAVNWGDFGCCFVERSVDSFGEVTYRMHVEEAAPDCPALHAFLWEHMEARGFPGVEVVTEW